MGMITQPASLQGVQVVDSIASKFELSLLARGGDVLGALIFAGSLV